MKLVGVLAAGVCLCGVLPRVGAVSWSLDEAGVRFAFPATRMHLRFYQSEAHVLFDPHCELNLGRGWCVRAGADFSAGALTKGPDTAFVGTAGPVVSLRRDDFPVEMVFGSSPTYISRYEFGRVHLGVPFQFTSHAGLHLRLTAHWTVSYRFQHMSNASISPHNPGLDLHSVGFGYRF